MTLARRDVAEALGLKPIARWVGAVVIGVPPKIMGELLNGYSALSGKLNFSSQLGVGPAYAVPALFKRFGLTKEDIDIFELNEGQHAVTLLVMVEN